MNVARYDFACAEVNGLVYIVGGYGVNGDSLSSVEMYESNAALGSKWQTSDIRPSGAIPIPSFNAPIPDSLNTLSEFINRMERILSQNGYGPNIFSTNFGDQRVELPSNTQGLPTLEALTTVLHRAEQLLGGQAVSALSHIAGRMEREGTSADLGVRGQIQSESVEIGIAMQHLGALLLEQGRTMLTLRIGRSSAESVVHYGPAVYISASRPNPIMAQPFPRQTSSLFGGPLSSSTPTQETSITNDTIN
ncbi:hypothetical protein KIW84_050036 [Lathyrus oleraceus]|uniref:Uncharacterized protein n=1 Tax=Pisum sativum TaxID=3888 RepID=A0A9D5ABX8_PEA|nr:hypothetical protein KIW84_050036 [Pisum sativum]